MGYDARDSMVRADRFKPSGKWYDTVALDMSQEYDETFVTDACKKAWIRAGHDKIEEGWSVVILESYHANGYPVCMKNLTMTGREQ